MSEPRRHFHTAYESCTENARCRAKKLRNVARHISNARIEPGPDAERVKRRRAGTIGKLYEIARAQDQAADGDLDEDPGHLAQAVDEILDRALIEFQGQRIESGVDLVVGAAATIDAVLESMGLVDSDEIGEPDVPSPGRSAMIPAMDRLPLTRERRETVPEDRLKFGYRSMEVGLRAAEAGADGLPSRPTLFGNFAVFDEWTEINDMWEGTFMESISRGAFDQTFKEDRDQMRVLFQHGRDAMLGSKVLGPIEKLEETPAGAAYEVPLYRGIPELILEGLADGQYGASFRFEAIREEWNDKPKPSAYNPRGIPERKMLQLRVAEFGPVTFPAYTSATAGLRSRSLTAAFYTGRPRTGSAGGGVQVVTTTPELQAEADARDRAWRMRRLPPRIER